MLSNAARSSSKCEALKVAEDRINAWIMGSLIGLPKFKLPYVFFGRLVVWAPTVLRALSGAWRLQLYSTLEVSKMKDTPYYTIVVSICFSVIPI